MTPEDIYKAGCVAIPLQAPAYEQISDESKAYYGTMTQVLNKEHIEPRDALLRACMAMLNGAFPPCVDLAETQAWCAQRDDLDMRVKQLIGKEVKKKFPDMAICEACGEEYKIEEGYYEQGNGQEGILAYSYCAGCCHW